VDCRSKDEFLGGHIASTETVHYPESDLPAFLKYAEDIVDNMEKTTIFVFHCEFSQYRGPLMHTRFYTWLREKEPREILESYVLESGYKNFFNTYPEFCEPRGYVEGPRLEGKAEGAFDKIERPMSEEAFEPEIPLTPPPPQTKQIFSSPELEMGTPPPRRWMTTPPKIHFTTRQNSLDLDGTENAPELSCFQIATNQCWDGDIVLRNKNESLRTFSVFREPSSCIGSFIQLFRPRDNSATADFLGFDENICIKVYNEFHLEKKALIMMEYTKNGLAQYVLLRDENFPIKMRLPIIYNVDTAMTDGYVLSEYIPKSFAPVQREWESCDAIENLSQTAMTALTDVKTWFTFSVEQSLTKRNGFLVLDLKPENLRLDKENRIVLCDFMEIELPLSEMMPHFRQCSRLLGGSNPVISKFLPSVDDFPFDIWK
jgi:hypothetical protein